MATHARQQYFADERSLSKENREFSIADDIQQKIDSIEEGAQVNKIETVKVNGTALAPDANKAVNVEVPEVIDNLYTVDSDNALSAKQGKLLYDYIQNIASRGRFLSNWNSATGLPTTNPSESPYPYKSGDYFVVSNVATSGGTNYRPDGSSYTIGQASTVVETEDVSVSDFYFYDGTNWLLLSNSGRQIAVDSSLSTTSTNPVENRVITNALNGKQNILTAGNHIDITNNAISAEGFQEELTAGENITIGDIYTTESDMKGPCPSGFHVPLNTEWQAVYDIWTALGGGSSDGTNFGIALKLPFAGRRKNSSAGVDSQGTYGSYWSSTRNDNNSAYRLYFNSSDIGPQSTLSRTNGCSVRCFKNSPTVPTSSWTKLYGISIESGGIFWSSTEGLISMSSDGQTWITIADKNLGATTVWNSGDTLSEANCGKYYQRGNNYGFPRTGSVTTSSTQVDASNYGPGNYYSSDTFIKYGGRWDSGDNGNLWGGVTQGTWQECIHNVISAIDTKYTAGTGINIDSNNVISATATPGQTYTAGDGINIDANNEISNTLPGPTIAATAPTGTEGALWYDTTNNVLMAYNGTAWKEAGTQMKVLSYGHSTWQDFLNAYNENAVVYCRASSNSDPSTGSQTRMAFMAYVNNQTNPTEVEFQYYRSRSSHSTAANVLDEVYVYKLVPASGGTWTVTQRDTAAKPIAGTGIGLTYNASGMTISADTTVLATQTDLNSKQDTLVSGTNIKTVNNESLLGSGNITISAPTYTAGENITIDQNNEISAVDTTYTAGPGIEIKNGNDYSSLKGPCPDGYHVPTLSEFSDLVTKFLSLGLGRGTFYTYYKVPMAGFAGGDSGYSFRDTGTQAKLVLATAESENRTYYTYVTTDYVAATYNLYKGYYGYSLRPFKDEPAIPDSNWTVLYQGTGDAGIYHNATDGLISLSADGTNWITVADKNLGATQVWNNGDTLSEANCGKFYQWGNNYGFPGVNSDTSGVITSSTKVDASSYGPGEYSSSTFIITGADWSSVTNNNLWGGVTGVIEYHNAITNIGVLSGDNGIVYTIKVSNSDPASGTPNTTITLVP